MMRVLILGASGTVGQAAQQGLGAGHEIIEVSRSTSPSVDITDPAAIGAMFEQVGQVDAVVSCLGVVPFKPLGELTREDYLAAFQDKVLGQVELVRQGTSHVRDGGSFTLTSGVTSRAPISTGVAASLANGALESFTMAAAAELPRGIRINCVSPGVLASAPDYHPFFPGFVPVTDQAVGAAYLRSVAGVETGQTFVV